MYIYADRKNSRLEIEGETDSEREKHHDESSEEI